MPKGIRIGDITLSFPADVQENLYIDPAYRLFISSNEPDIHLRLHQEIFEGPGGKKAFDCPPIWSLVRKEDTRVVEIFSDIPALKRVLVFKSPLKEADLYLGSENPDPLYGPTMELLMVNYLAQGHGLILHACGVVWEGKGLLFVGESGAGKSTMAGLWAHDHGAQVLSDDRTIVRKKGNGFRVYGTPWHGEGKFGSPGSAVVEKIYFLSHGEENTTKDVRSIDAASRLLTCSFPPYWDPEGMAFTLEVISELTAKVRCQGLRFKPDGSVIEMLKG